MAGSSFGERLKMTTFGESHGEAVGVIVEGVTPNAATRVEATPGGES